jgi:hypothetical protein
MAKEVALNELSIIDVDSRHHDLILILLRLIEICRIAGVPRIALWQDLKDSGKEDGKRLGALLIAVAKSNAKQRNDLRRISNLFNKAETFADNYLDEIRFNEKIAHGLGHAFRFKGLALSLDSHAKWSVSSLPVHVHALDEISQDWAIARPENVRHAAEPNHLAEHDDWAELEERDRLRIRLETMPINHVPASNYKGKHVKGATNDQRRTTARGPAGQNQYLAEFDGTAVNDETITRWEKEALERVKQGRDCFVEFHGGDTFHVYCDLGKNIGYDSPNGDLISWIRVEWTTSGAVHSHPRRPPDHIAKSNA